MIYVINTGWGQFVGHDRTDLSLFLMQTATDAYAESVLEWFDQGAVFPLTISNGLDGTDRWEEV